MIKRNIPNAITCGNLFCGCLAIVKCFEGNLVWAAYLVGIAAVLDFLDGFAARLLKASSPIGKDLDSLADMVTFGVVPGILIYKLIGSILIERSAQLEWVIYPPLSAFPDKYPAITDLLPSEAAFIAFLIPIFSAIRLAKFNNDLRQSESFIGLPTPANAILICSLPLIIEFNKGSYILTLILNPFLLVFATILLSFLLVAPLPLFSLKFKSFRWQGNEIRYLFLILSLVLLSLFKFIGVPLVIFSYILFSVGNNLINPPKKTIS